MLRRLIGGLLGRGSEPAALPETPVDGWETWDGATTAESFPEITTPATFSFARRFYRAAYRDLARMRGMPPADLAACEPIFGGILGYLQGRIYVRDWAWAAYEHALAGLPAPKREARDLPRLLIDYLAWQGQAQTACAAGAGGLALEEAVARYREAEATLFSGAGLTVATDMRVIRLHGDANAALEAAGIDPAGPAGALLLARPDMAAVETTLGMGGRAPGEMLLERPDGGRGVAAERVRALLGARAARIPVPAPPPVPAPVEARLAAAREWLGWRERMRGARAGMFGTFRVLLRALGARLASEGALTAPDDVWCLTVEEILDFCDGCAADADLRPLVAARFAHLADCRADPPPDFLETRAPASWRPCQRMAPDAAAGSAPGAPLAPGAPSEWRGVVAWPGRVEGIARVVRDPAAVTDLGGAILVASHTDPGWTPLFMTASAIVVEHGNPLCHAAILARELGLPALVGVRGIAGAVQDGDRLLVDATAGVVRLV